MATVISNQNKVSLFNPLLASGYTGQEDTNTVRPFGHIDSSFPLKITGAYLLFNETPKSLGPISNLVVMQPPLHHLRAHGLSRRAKKRLHPRCLMKCLKGYRCSKQGATISVMPLSPAR